MCSLRLTCGVILIHVVANKHLWGAAPRLQLVSGGRYNIIVSIEVEFRPSTIVLSQELMPRQNESIGLNEYRLPMLKLLSISDTL